MDRGKRCKAFRTNGVRTVLEKALTDRRHYFGDSTCLYFSVPEGLSMAAFVDVRHPLSELDHKLLEVFCSNISVAFENTHLLQRISELAYEDTLLKMPNRNRFLAHIDQRPAASDRLALVDLDGFADINSVLDQDFGDAVPAGRRTPLALLIPGRRPDRPRRQRRIRPARSAGGAQSGTDRSCLLDPF